ncbi:ribonuclease P [Methanoplanus sp. FWC-SCC4]|uniref:Ribonuclease P protein component 2 n=1 Tax=Methanochimaera problematica TaxID=2609417 RepID=A0AA97FCL1_9EURY|nr:Rpp14/Pop5 family protein [Methanoplanus sp. FWC-SCC4]WOF16407.1 ribonuclease P [Methanoplanus sp. FWC-SCC4]
MKPLPPTLREKRRYILLRIVPNNAGYDGKSLYYAIYDAVVSLFGDSKAAEINMAVVFSENNYVIVRCIRGSEEFLKTALATVYKISGINCGLRPVAVSGTIASLKKRISQTGECSEEEIVLLGEESYSVFRCSREKVDLYKEGIKHQDTLYFTRDDLEEL